ncbi:MAG: superoxide dismutase [Microcystis novacekii Mn_MB_F_20050700_S1]|uniref:Superoxide dismutase n=1 Tax=Microcystis novacekii Mn_MB_F_20050700_S1D TaxID=2486266 RepID=A0A552J891_9CHRO|nr:MAG: superoxide dismutase [Microcystis novacekii Mn_MB_F_20050700_S1]TRU91996.1 MAG: superoxide dismutase [Microcystis novacekii Mn_MB_F_20050700_S1D]
MPLDRRQFLYLLGATLGTATLGNFNRPALAANSPYTLLPLPYAYDALEPYIDKETMQFHHDKHHVAYVNNLNTAVAKYPELQQKTVVELIKNLDSLPADIRTTIRNNGGGDLNHTMFWQIMSPDGGGEPTGEIGAAIIAKFGSFEEFKNAFNQAGTKLFGSGWTWLVLNKSGELEIISTANQDSPLMMGLQPIMGNDVWEHAYYLKYRNQRAEYLKQWWNVVNWEEVNRRYLQAKA